MEFLLVCKRIHSFGFYQFSLEGVCKFIMNTVSRLVMVSLVVGVLATPCFAGQGFTRLTRGLGDTLTSPMQLPREIGNEFRADTGLVGLTTGVGRGAYYTVRQLGFGLYDVVSSPVYMVKDLAR